MQLCTDDLNELVAKVFEDVTTYDGMLNALRHSSVHDPFCGNSSRPAIFRTVAGT